MTNALFRNQSYTNRCHPYDIMENLNNVLEEYLKTQTNYAVLITGKWGSGKTYYYKNVVSKIIEQTPTFDDASIKYKSIQISLFGLSSLEDIQTQIFLSIYPLLKNKTLKLSAGIGKSIARGIMSLKNLGNIDDYIDDVKPETADWLKYNQLVICFDDLERISKNLLLEELIGFINSLVENNDAKIVLIANEDKINNTEYADLKEKVVGITIEYVSEFSKNVEAIINHRYTPSYKEYSDFLNKNMNIITEFSEKFDNNLRTLIFALDKLQTIYSEIKINILDIKSKSHFVILEKLENIVRFTLAVSIEYKLNEITFSKRLDLDQFGFYVFEDLDQAHKRNFGIKDNTESEIEKTYRTKFLESYYPLNDDYKFYESIYAYVTGAVNFILENLLDDVNKAFHISNEKVLPQYEILENLKHPNCYELDNIKYRSFTRKMLQYAEKGEYALGNYLTIFHFAFRFDNVLNLNPEKVKDKIIKGLKKGEKNMEYVYSLDLYLDVPEGSKYKAELTKIRDKAVAINNEIIRNEEEKEVKELLEEIDKNWTGFLSKLTNTNGKWPYKDIFNHTSAHKIYLTLNRFDFQKLQQFNMLLTARYRKHIHPELTKELTFLKMLSEKLEPNSKIRKKKNLKNYLLNTILENVKTGIERMK